MTRKIETVSKPVKIINLTCTVEGCDKERRLSAPRKRDSKYCGMHRSRLNKKGDLGSPDPIPTHKLSNIEHETAYCQICGHVNVTWRELGNWKGWQCQYRVKDVALRSKYNITLNQFWNKLESQEYKCMICTKPINDKSAHVDHDHTCCDKDKKSCGKCIRDLLCFSCNTGIGQLGDDVDIMISAIKYINRHRQF